MARIGSPLTSVPVLVAAVPLEWGLLAWLLLKGHGRTAAVWLSIKALAIPWATRINLKTDSLEHDWALWLSLLGSYPIEEVVLCGFVAAGYLTAWAFVLFPERLRRSS